MFTTFTALVLAGGGLRLVLEWQLKRRWDISLAVPQALAGARPVNWHPRHRGGFEVPTGG